MVINTNVQALQTANNLNTSSNALAKSLSRLSSGSKIIAPSDDAAGLEPIADAPPFSWLKFQGDTTQSFLVVAPVYVTDSYRCEVGSTDCRTLNLTRASDAGVINIVTLRRDGSLTVNLKGPIVYNKLTGEARQVVPINAAELPVNCPVAN